MKKRIIYIIILSLLISLFHVNSVKADFVSNIQKAKEARDALMDYVASDPAFADNATLQRQMKQLVVPIGLMVGYGVFSKATFEDFFNGKNYGGIIIGDNGSDKSQDFAEAVVNNITISGDQININPVGRQILNDYSSFIEENYGYKYFYAHDIQNDSIGNAKSWLETKLMSYQRNSICTIGSWSSQLGLDVIPGQVLWIEDNSTTDYLTARPYSSNLVSLGGSGVEHYYFWGERSSDSYQEKTENTTYNTYYKFVSSPTLGTWNDSGQLQAWGQVGFYIFSNVEQFDGVQEVGIPQYYTTSNWQDFSSTIDNSNSNNLTFGDITNYINSYNTENGSNPTPQQINIYIENNKDSGSGGGGSGGDSGGGSGGSGDGSSIWDFLSRLGEVLGGLIKNLGNMLTSLIDSIVTIINDVIGKIPQVFNGLLEVVFGGLPEDMRGIIILGITVMVVYGIIKVIRG